MNLILITAIVYGLGIVSGYISGYNNGFENGYYHGYDDGEIWDRGYSNGFVSGYEESIIWYPIYSKDIYINHYNNSVLNWDGGTSAEDSFKKLEAKYYERRK